jgi:predicted nucleic-acid-binding Zn-ribbon protein
VPKCPTTGLSFESAEPDPKCPHCGCRHLERAVSDDTSGNWREELAHRVKGDSTEAIGLSAPDRSVSANLSKDGQLSISTKAKPRHGEVGTQEVCEKLIQRLNKEGRNWTDCRCTNTQDDDVDCRGSEGDKVLEIQVTRVVPGQHFWKDVSLAGSSEVNLNVEQAAEQLRMAIEKKSVVARKSLTLAIDAIETPGHVVELVVSKFRQLHGAWAKEQGFDEIWVVGPADLTYRLDTAHESRSEK